MSGRLDLEKCSKNLYPMMEQLERVREVRVHLSSSEWIRGTMGSSPMSGGSSNLPASHRWKALQGTLESAGGGLAGGLKVE
ncbi:hypothetical protein CEXT_764371 [Caerostris extrusa]|uniref:Uncharacterized protein n=1 Tax=Caerostris extrusa TaxID=172846 RepID=A0AAV4R220_CAEEX|nr:hypothetical protein CEXT_764371 [Caerostris extrusa]